MDVMHHHHYYKKQSCEPSNKNAKFVPGQLLYSDTLENKSGLDSVEISTVTVENLSLRIDITTSIF